MQHLMNGSVNTTLAGVHFGNLKKKPHIREVCSEIIKRIKIYSIKDFKGMVFKGGNMIR